MELIGLMFNAINTHESSISQMLKQYWKPWLASELRSVPSGCAVLNLFVTYVSVPHFTTSPCSAKSRISFLLFGDFHTRNS